MKKIFLLIFTCVLLTFSAFAQRHKSYAQSYSGDSLKVNFFAYFSDFDSDTTSSSVVIYPRGGGKGREVQTQVYVMRQKETMQEIQSHRIAYFTDVMKLTPEEAQVFWPLYNQYTEKKNKLIEDRNKIFSSYTNIQLMELPKSDAEAIANKLAKSFKDEGDLQTDYHKKFRAILPANKVLQMYKADKEFMQNLLYHLRGTPKSGSMKFNFGS